MANNEQVIEQALIQETFQELQQEEAQTFFQLQTAAKIFIKNVGDYSKNDRLSNFQSLGSLLGLYTSMREDTDYTRQILAYQHEFENAINTFLSRTIYLTYVMEDGSLKYFDEADVGEIYKNAFGNRGRANISSSTMKNTESTTLLESRLQQKLKESERKKKATYLEAVARYNKNKSEKHMNYDPSKNTFYWWKVYHKTLGGMTSPIGNLGPIAEGYADAVINDDSQVNSNNLERALQALWENHIHKDSVGAAVKGDVVLDSNNNIQFAIKSGSYSTAMVGQYVRLAYNIIQFKALSADELQRFLPVLSKNVGKKSKEIIEKINEQVENEVIKKFDKYKNL